MQDKQSEQLVELSEWLTRHYAAVEYPAPVAYVYNPLEYAAQPHCNYLRRWGNSRKRVVFLGMNPGPYGMAQVGVPFGEIALVRDWLGIEGAVGQPPLWHPKKPVAGFACRRSEVSGKRLWGLFKERFVTPEAFFADHFVINLCPLLFLDEGGRNMTPDKLPAVARQETFALCDAYLQRIIEILQPEWLVAVGNFSYTVTLEAVTGLEKPLQVVKILHPSPANPQANADWKGIATGQLLAAGVWSEE